MKIKLGIFAILTSTVLLIAVLYSVINLDKPASSPEASQSDSEPKNQAFNHPRQTDPNNLEIKAKSAAYKALDPIAGLEHLNGLDHGDSLEGSARAQDRASAEPKPKLSPEDRKIIDGVASLSQHALEAELNSLKTRIEQEELFDQLEEGDLEDEEAEEAKQLLERFAILGLEGTRRKYQHIEPELKNPLYAHRESLKEIREMLQEY